MSFNEQNINPLLKTIYYRNDENKTKKDVCFGVCVRVGRGGDTPTNFCELRCQLCVPLRIALLTSAWRVQPINVCTAIFLYTQTFSLVSKAQRHRTLVWKVSCWVGIQSLTLGNTRGWMADWNNSGVEELYAFFRSTNKGCCLERFVWQHNIQFIQGRSIFSMSLCIKVAI